MKGFNSIESPTQFGVPARLEESNLSAGEPSPSQLPVLREERGLYAPHVLLIAYHFPPCGLSSGLQRTLCFSRDLSYHNWAPIVLTAHPRAYAITKTDQLSQIPPDVPVRAAFALDTPRHLGFRGRYAGWMALPDNWVSWLPGAVAAGILMVRKYRPRVLWSTYPIATAHLVGLCLHRITGIPWIADFRDPMTEEDPLTGKRFPEDARLWKVRRWIEKRAIQHCTRAVFVTPGSLEIHSNRYPHFASRMAVIGNGYDEENFAAAERVAKTRQTRAGQLLLVHSGVLYPGPDRDPTAFLKALASLRKQGKVSSELLQVRLRATGYDDYYRQQIREHGVEDIVSLDPPVPYQEALAEMLAADGLLVFQGRTSNPAVPAKLYEYLRSRRPIFALVDSEGDTAGVLRRAGIETQVPLDQPEIIESGIVRFLAEIRRGTSFLPAQEAIEEHSRKSKAKQLAGLLDEIVREQGAIGFAATAHRQEP